MDCSPPGSSVHGILQARILEWVCHALLQRIFLNQGLNPHLFCLLHWQPSSLPLAPHGKPQQQPKMPQMCSFILFLVKSFNFFYLPIISLSLSFFFFDIGYGNDGASQVALVVKNPPANAGDVRNADSMLGWGRSPGGGHDNPLHDCGMF